MIDNIKFTTDKGWIVESVGEIRVVIFPEGEFRRLGNIQQFTFNDDISLEIQIVIENQVIELIRKLETFKVGV